MNKSFKLALCLSPLLIAPHALMAGPAKPVEITGTVLNQPEKAPDKAVESALSDSVEAVAAPEKHKKYTKSKLQPVADQVVKAPSSEKVAPAMEVPVVDAMAPANASDYTLRAGDVLQITVWKEENLDREVVVLPDGTVTFPLIGSFVAEGLTPSQLQTTIKSKLRPLIPGASVAVLVKATLGHTVSVIGQVQKPGEIIMGHKLTVLQALSQAGGLTPYASEGSIIVLRTVNGKESAIEFPYSDIIYGDNLDKNFTLNPGDVVVVPTASLF
jgi:polysaccharide export outer membrane protein